jgi:hypothetical protein
MGRFFPPAVTELSDAVVERVRAALKDSLKESGWKPQRPLPRALANKAVHEAVAFYLAYIEAITDRLTPKCLEEFIARNELLLLAGHPGNESTPEQNSIAVAGRFLVELAAASPPEGQEELTTATYETLLAAGAEMVNLGRVSDLLGTPLHDLEVWIDEDGWFCSAYANAEEVRLLAFVQSWFDGARSRQYARWPLRSPDHQHRATDAARCHLPAVVPPIVP